jgi:hypothetical protein
VPGPTAQEIVVVALGAVEVVIEVDVVVVVVVVWAAAALVYRRDEDQALRNEIG